MYVPIDAIKNEKVYCKNCKYSLYRYSGVMMEWVCRKILKSEIFDYPYGQETFNDYANIKENKNNDCKYYKKRWYKFWIY